MSLMSNDVRDPRQEFRLRRQPFLPRGEELSANLADFRRFFGSLEMLCKASQPKAGCASELHNSQTSSSPKSAKSAKSADKGPLMEVLFESWMSLMGASFATPGGHPRFKITSSDPR